MSLEIARCLNCTHSCDNLYQRAATEILFSERNLGAVALEDKKHLLRLRLRGIGGCALTEGQIDDNLQGLTEGNRVLNG
jgi:hypothetical protein